MANNCFNLNDVLRTERESIGLPASSEERPAPLSALCFSGGGIRSATFCLGALQALADLGMLERFDYLSTVSGGGYIGSWLTAWATRAPGGIDEVAERLRKGQRMDGDKGPDPVQHLRAYNNYLTPELGAFSEDTWTLIATVVRNIALNWLVLIPLLLCFLMAPRLLLALGMMAEYYQKHGSAMVSIGLQGLCSLLYGFALFHIFLYLPGVGGRPHTRKAYLLRVLAPLTSATLLYCAYDARIAQHNHLFEALLLWNLLVTGVVWLLVLLFVLGGADGKRSKLCLGLLGAIALLALSQGTMEWIISNKLVDENTPWRLYATFVPPLLGLSFCTAFGIFAGLSSRLLDDEDREWMSRASAGVLMSCTAWLGVCLIVLIVPDWIFGWKAAAAVFTGGGASGWMATRVGKLAASRSEQPGQGGGWRVWAVKLAPPLFVLAVAVALAMGTNILLYGLQWLLVWMPTEAPWVGMHAAWWDHPAFVSSTGLIDAGVAMLLFLGLALTMAPFININRFSLNAMYRDRLIRAYLGASNPARSGAGLNRFTGFADSDNLAMHELTRKPFHVLNLTLNVVSGEQLAWQQRKAMSFSVTPLHCGNHDLGYRESNEYGGGISLGSAVSISGAAASPSMGEKSSTILGFIMTLLNARLGAWLGNPGPAGQRTWQHKGPRSAIKSLVSEALGLTNSQSEYVYLSDGGHFENLALYEMILRQCRMIVVIDSGCDPEFKFEDLGNALRKIRIDLKVSIAFDDEAFQQVRDNKKRCAAGTISYPDGRPGRLLYIKPMLLGNEPPDIVSYAKANPTFPHQTTADQWFSESQTESYRLLGQLTVLEALRDEKLARS